MLKREEEFELEDKRSIPIVVMIAGAVLLFLVSMLAGALFMHFRSRGIGVSGNKEIGAVTKAAGDMTESSESLSSETAEDESVENSSAEIESSESISSETVAAETEVIQEEPRDIVAGHLFKEVKETITAKEATNLRDIPSQGEESHIMMTLQNGQTAERTAVSDSGWSRVVYNGETYYAVSSLLTTDLSVKPKPTAVPDDGIETEFTPCDDVVSPKIEVNLRNIPSVTSTDSQVIATVKYGEIFRRTGYNEELGWSRIEYDGQTLYCVSSYIYIYEEPKEE